MRSIKIFCLLTVLFYSAFSQGATTSAKTPAQAPVKPLHPYPKMTTAQAAEKFQIRMKCDSIYGAEIKKRTVDLQKKVMDLMQTERTTENTKRQNNSSLKKIHETLKLLHVKDSLAYRDTSVNKMKLRQDAQNERMAAIQKMQAEEAKIFNDPELQNIRKAIVDLRKQINDTIAVIVKDDATCLECYKRR